MGVLLWQVANARTRMHTHARPCTHTHAHAYARTNTLFAAHGRTSSAADRSRVSRSTRSVHEGRVTGVVGSKPPSGRKCRSEMAAVCLQE
eukprot:804796-Alexandrium_andersonii.AAC.1